MFAVIAVLLATLGRYLLDPYLGGKAPLLLFTLPVILCALFSGVLAALVSTMLGLLSSIFFFTGNPGDLVVEDPADHVQLALFALIALTIIGIGGSRKAWSWHSRACAMRARRA